MKKIAITQKLVKDNQYHEVRNVLDIRWAKLFNKLGYLPVLLPSHYDFRVYFDTMRIEGIILSGGNDLSLISNDELSIERDAVEKKIIEYAIRKSIPVFGVCRGMQLIADYFRGKIKKVKNHARTEHRITASNGTRFREEIRKLNKVKSFHNYGVTDIDEENFIIAAFSEDGVVEAIEHKSYRIWGQMWHPEREYPFSKMDIEIIKNYFG